MEESHKKKERETSLLESFDHAVRGVLFCVRQERNFRIHLIAAFAVLFGSIFLDLNLIEFYILLLVITLVLVAEMVNTALERLVDVVAPEYSRRVREIKNIAAACVLVTAVVSLFIGYLILGTHLPARTETAVTAIKRTPWYLTVIGLLATIALVFFIKIRLRSRSLFHGGMPSGHAALSFGLLAAIFYTTESLLVAALALPLAVLVSQSRVREGIHTWLEVLYGAALGAGVVTFIFQLISWPK